MKGDVGDVMDQKSGYHSERLPKDRRDCNVRNKRSQANCCMSQTPFV